MSKKVIHQVSLVNIGGVQKMFVDYWRYASTHYNYRQQVIGFSDLDEEYKNVMDYENIKNSLLGKSKFAYYLNSNTNIVHFYNNASKRLSLLLSATRANKTILHERGRAWNLPSAFNKTYQKLEKQVDVIIANSHATKTLLNKKFGICESNIIVVHNGLKPFQDNVNFKKSANVSVKRVGFIGRLNTPKGAHILLEAAKVHCDRKDIKYVFAGNGPLLHSLENESQEINNVEFLGRVSDPYQFLKSIDILVVPSIREPLGNVCIEAGYCNTPVIAANIDGIPEIIDDGVSGILISPDKPLNIRMLKDATAAIPECVVDPVKNDLTEPKEICPEKLVSAIELLLNDENLAQKYAANLNAKVSEEFTIEKYSNEIDKIYRTLWNK